MTRMEERRDFSILTGKPTGKRYLGRPRRRRKDHNGMGLTEICAIMRNCVDSGQERDYWLILLNTALNLWTS